MVVFVKTSEIKIIYSIDKVNKAKTFSTGI